MLPYYILTGVVVILSCLSEIVRKHFTDERRREAAKWGLSEKRQHAWTPIDILVVGALVIFAALRYQVGTDYDMYIRRFEQINTSDWQEQIDASPQELGYTVLSLALRTISDSPFTIFWVMSALTVIPICITIKKKSANVPLALALFIMLAFFVSPFNVMRQGVAVALNFWASTFLDKNKTMFVLLNFLASLFHTSVLIVAVVQLLARNWRPTAARILVLLAATAVAAVALSQVSIIGEWLALLNPRYETYVTEEGAGLGTYLLIALYLALLIFSRMIAPLGSNARYFTFVLLGAAFLMMGTQAVVLSRMEMYLSIFLILLIPNQIAKQETWERRALSIALVSSAAAIFFAFYLANWGDLIPYQTYIGVMR